MGIYTSDGVHLSKNGKEKLGDLINLNLYNLLCKLGNYQSEQKEKIGQQSGDSGKILTTQSVNTNISINIGRKIMAIFINMKVKVEKQQVSLERKLQIGYSVNHLIYSQKQEKISGTKRLRGVLINARSIRNKFRELQALVTVKLWGIIAITETQIHSQDRDFIGEFRLNGYCLFNKDRINKERGGVLLLIRETLKQTEINLVTNHELICIYINLNIKIRLVLVYQEPKQNIQLDENLYQTMGTH